MKERLRHELVRKAFHLSGITVPLAYFYFGREIAILYTAIFLLFFVILEFVRVRAHSIFPFGKAVDFIERQSEKTSIAASIYFCIAALGALFFFGESAVVTGLCAALLGDAAAALVGVSLGTHMIKRGKTLEGTLAGIVISALVAYLLNPNFVTIIGVGFIFLIFDLVDFRIDDNFTLPLAMVMIIQLVEWLL